MLNFYGEYNNSKKYKFGDIITKEGKTCVYTTSNNWEELSYTSFSIPTPKIEYRPKICTQCGAPFHGDKCEYCDTEFYLSGR